MNIFKKLYYKLFPEMYYVCKHNVIGNNIYFLLKTCLKCRGDLQANADRVSVFIDEYKKECRERYQLKHKKKGR